MILLAVNLTLGLSLSAASFAAQTAQAEHQQAMAADAHPGFEVATIRPSNPDKPDTSPPEMGHRVVMSDTTVRFLIAFAYDVHDRQILGGPDWTTSEKFDLHGIADVPGTPNLQQLQGMLQRLLAERFQLQFHRQQKEMSAYVLTVARNGLKLENSRDDPNGMPSLLMQPGLPKMGVMKARNVSMSNFAQLLQSGILDRPVVDHTNLHGRYDFLMRWTPDDSQFTQLGVRLPPPVDTSDPPSLSTAMQEELGLRLSAEKRTIVEMLVLDRLEKPSPN